MAVSADTLRRTPLHDRHAEAGARLVAFAGWEMPLQYTGIREEHTAVRTGVGLFDVSHMGRIEVSGPDAQALLQRTLSNDVAALTVGGAQYAVLCRPDGGVLDDLLAYRLASDRFLAVSNAANHERDLAWLREHAAGLDVEVADRREAWAMLAVQGPGALALVGALADAPLPPRRRVGTRTVAGARRVLVCGTGYTGEDGVELLLAPESASAVWDALVARGATPAGLGARDTLRLEACLPLYGHELSERRGPIEAGLGWCCREETGFVGAEAVAAARATGPAERLAAFVLTEGGIPRQGNAIAGGGEVTSGTFSPSLGVGIGLGYLPAASALPGSRIAVDVRGRLRRAEVRPKPLYPTKEP